jgi:hypothetical protein
MVYLPSCAKRGRQTMPDACAPVFGAGLAVAARGERPRQPGKLSAVPLFFPRFHATVDAGSSGDALKIVRLIDCAELPVRTLEIHGPATITLNGQAVLAEPLPPVEGLARFRVDLHLKAGDHLRFCRTT